MKKSIIFYSILIFLFAGCNKVVSKLYGIKSPKFEKVESLTNFKNSTFGPEIPFYIVSFDQWVKKAIFTIPDVYVFAANGEYIPYRDSLKPNCNGGAELFLEQLDPKRKYHFSDEWTLLRFLNALESPGCSGAAEVKSGDVDFYIFFTWVNFTGKKIYREKTDFWLQSLKNNKQINYQLYMVNQDLQDCWSDDQKMRFDKPK